MSMFMWSYLPVNETKRSGTVERYFGFYQIYIVDNDVDIDVCFGLVMSTIENMTVKETFWM